MRILSMAALLLVAASATAETAYFRVDLLPSGSLVAIGAPVAKGAALLVHGYPDGKLMSLRKSDVKSVTPITAQEAAKPAQQSVTRIADLPMQGGTAPGGSGSAGSAPKGATATGPRVISTSGGMAITTGSSTVPGPRIIPTSDGMAITTIPSPN